MITSSTIHDVERIRARAQRSENAAWVWLHLISGDQEHTVTVFLPSYDQAKALADAINGVSVPALEAAE